MSIITVTTANDDENGGAGGVSLREAIAAANATTGADTIKFSTSLTTAKITLTKGQLQIKNDLTVEGNGVTISGNNQNRVLLIDNGNGNKSNVNLQNLKIIRGKDTDKGGGIFNREKLTITNSVISGNSAQNAGGLYNKDGAVRIVNSTITGNRAGFRGGGLYNRPTNEEFIVINSTVSGNSSGGGGGGLLNYGKPIILNSTFSGNRSKFGGGVENFGQLTLNNSTFSGNSAENQGGGILNRSGQVSIFNSTITQNIAPNTQGGGLAGDGGGAGRITQLVNTIVAGNIGSDVDRINGTNQTFISLGNNLIGNGNQATRFNQSGDQRGVIDPGLGLLASNGGATRTHALLSSSAAIDKGNNSRLPLDTYDLDGDRNTTEQIPIDQTGKARIFGSTVDIGAVEFKPPVLSVRNVSVTEGNTGTTFANFAIALDKATTRQIKVLYNSANGSGSTGAVAPTDYTAAINQTLVIQPNITTATISIPIKGDLIFEPNETFTLNLSNPVNTTLAQSQAQGTIINNDPKPKINIGDATVNEGNSGITTARFAVTLTNPSSQTITAKYATSNGTAVVPSDYNSSTGVLTFTAGQTAKTVNIQVKGDVIFEPLETFSVRLTGLTNVDAGDLTGVGNIRNDDSRPLVGRGDSFSLFVSTSQVSEEKMSFSLGASTGAEKFFLEGISQPDLLVSDFQKSFSIDSLTV